MAKSKGKFMNNNRTSQAQKGYIITIVRRKYEFAHRKTLRFRTKDGMKRVSAKSDDDFLDVIENLLTQLPGSKADTLQIGIAPQGQFESIARLAGKTVAELGFKHGELLYVKYESEAENNGQPQSEPQHATAQSVTINQPKKLTSGNESNAELPVDVALDAEEGFIKRPRDNKFCKHSDRGMCEYCSPLPPWDKKWLEENKIKHSSFHSYLKELNYNTNKNTGSSYIKPLEQSNYAIDKNCTNGHEPWPKGICSKCQPSAITLQQQNFRMVDHLEFVNSSIVNNFIESWRKSGTQRIGVLYGTYEKYDKVPLGIKGVVQSIYEPSQNDENDGLTLNSNWEEEVAKVDEFAKQCGLYKIGVVFTDLNDAGNGDGTVICKRHKDSYFLTSLEVIFAAKLQIKNPNVTKYSSSGVFSSKFVTCVISGNLQNEIDIQTYQVSENAEALVKADIITGSTHPSMAFINETNESRYVPEIFYNKINEYKLQVKVNAKPAFPVEYLLITLTHGFPQDQSTTNSVFRSDSFPVENRQALGISQDLSQLQKSLKTDGFNVEEIINSLSDFHLLIYLNSLDILSKDEFALCVKAAVDKKFEDCYRLIEQPGWQTLSTILLST